MVDPVLRCDACQKLVITKELLKIGCCNHCGNRRVKNAMIIRDEEMKKLSERGDFEDFFLLYDPIKEQGIWQRAYDYTGGEGNA